MTTVAQAQNDGWTIVEYHLASDNNIALMKHEKSKGLWEFGFAVWDPNAVPAGREERPAHHHHEDHAPPAAAG